MLYRVIKTSHMTVLSSYYAVVTLHVTVILSHSVVPLFFLIFDGYILILCSSNFTFNSTFVTFGGFLFFFTFNIFILTLCSFKITCGSSFITFGGSLIFFSHLTVPLLLWIVLVSFLTVHLSHSMVPFLFITFDNSIVTLGNTNITSYCTFVTFIVGFF